MAPFVHVSHARTRTALVTVPAVWVALFLAWAIIDAAPLIIAILGLFTLPALYDLVVNPRAELTLDDDRLGWKVPRSHADISLAEIDHVRLDTRLDLSVKGTVILASGRKLRIPVPAMPPHEDFESALQDRGIVTRRHHFSLMQ